MAIHDYIASHDEGNDTFTLETWQDDPQFKAIPTLFSDDDKWINYIQSSN
ncbi:MAG TPA: hypothetical protein VF220_04080 [Nitrososphaeraceae archaeon]